MKHLLWGIVALVAIIAGTYALRYALAPIEGRVGAQEQIQSAPNRIQAYNYFFDLHGAIKSYDTALKALNEQLGATTGLDEQERIRATIAGLKGQKARAIQQYNADARKDYTIGQFRDSGLPYQISE